MRRAKARVPAQLRLEPRDLASAPSRSRIGTWSRTTTAGRSLYRSSSSPAAQGAQEKGFSSSATLAQTSMCARLTSQTAYQSSHSHILVNIRDVSGRVLNVYGTPRVRVLLDGTVDTVILFKAADATRPIVSLGKLTRQDCSVHLERQTSRIERGGRRASLITGHNTFYFDALIP